MISNSFFGLLATAGWMAQFVLLLLVGASIACWGIIFNKWRVLRLARSQDSKFLAFFWTGKNMDEVAAKADKFLHSPVASVFKSGMKEIRKLNTGDATPLASDRGDNVLRAMVRAATSEVSALEKNVGWLATTASAAPFVGLFGTVWGIIHSLQGMGSAGGANIAVVAPGISEALITTAMGIGAAIPAVVFYNYFAGQIKRTAVDMECFSQDFMNIVHRSSITGPKK